MRRQRARRVRAREVDHGEQILGCATRRGAQAQGRGLDLTDRIEHGRHRLAGALCQRRGAILDRCDAFCPQAKERISCVVANSLGS
jgi:hypothetical protein